MDAASRWTESLALKSSADLTIPEIAAITHALTTITPLELREASDRVLDTLGAHKGFEAAQVLAFTLMRLLSIPASAIIALGKEPDA